MELGLERCGNYGCAAVVIGRREGENIGGSISNDIYSGIN